MERIEGREKSIAAVKPEHYAKFEELRAKRRKIRHDFHEPILKKMVEEVETNSSLHTKSDRRIRNRSDCPSEVRRELSRENRIGPSLFDSALSLEARFNPVSHGSLAEESINEIELNRALLRKDFRKAELLNAEIIDEDRAKAMEKMNSMAEQVSKQAEAADAARRKRKAPQWGMRILERWERKGNM